MRRRRRSGGLAVLAAVLLLPAIVLLSASPATAAPSDQPGGTSGVLDSQALDELQAQAVAVQVDLQQHQTEVGAARDALAAAQATAQGAGDQLAAAEAELTTRQQEVAVYAAALYRDGYGSNTLALLLDSADPGEVVSALGYLDAVEEHTTDVLAQAEASRQAALAQQAAAAEALAAARTQADAVDAQVDELEASAAAVTTQLDAALGAVDRQLAQLQQEQLDVNAATALNWQGYLDQLAAAGVVPPPVAALLDPATSVPAPLVAVGSATGGAQSGAAQLPRQPSSLLVLPAETLAAVSAALGELGLPYAPGTSGPESFDCGSLVQSAYGAAGIALPGTQEELYATTSPVSPADVLPGDLVFLDAGESGLGQVGSAGLGQVGSAGLGHVGIALDPQTMIAADARAGAVVVRTLPGGEVLGIGRPSLPGRDPVDVPGATGGALQVQCGGTVYPTSYDGSRAWGGYPNGLIPSSALCPLGVAGHQLRCDAAAAYRAMSAAFAASFGTPLCITDSYRPYASQVQLYGEKPALAAVPGTSNHGWGLAVDLCGGIESYSSAQYAWMVADAGRFGFLHPTWADPGNGREEPWHWEYAGS